MTSHREAPSISKDPAADNTDVYAFVSPDDSTTVTLIANYIPFEEAAGGPNFFQFGDDVLYEIIVDTNGDSLEDITYQFRFTTQIMNPNTFLYNVGPIGSLTDPNWNVRQVYSVTKVAGLRRTGQGTVLGTNLPCPPVRIGPRSTPNYPALANAAVKTLGSGEKVFCGQREEAFNVDLGSIFDLGTLRPFQNLHLIPTAAASGKDDTKGYNVHSIALQVPKFHFGTSIIGVWASASRQKVRVLPGDNPAADPGTMSGPFTQISRLGNPLINEVVIPASKKDFWNSQHPVNDQQFQKYYVDPELQNFLPVLYPGVFPNLAALLTKPLSSRLRNDLVAILLTGLPSGIVSGFTNFTGSTPADMLRLNFAIPPSASPSPFGVVGGDLAGWPNGRRLIDNVVAIELRAIAGVTYPLVASYTADGAAGLLTDGTSNDVPALSSFPYLGHPHEGYEHSH